MIKSRITPAKSETTEAQMQELRRMDRIAPLYPSGGLFCSLRPSYKQGQSGKEAQGGNAGAKEANPHGQRMDSKAPRADKQAYSVH